MNELITLYKQCFPEKDAKKQIKALGENFHYEILPPASFIIYMIISPDEAEIIDIGTAPEHRKKGMAEKLILQLTEKLKGKEIRSIYLEVAENNTAAIALYKKTGFVQYSMRKNYYNIEGAPQNAILMKKSFDIISQNL